MRNTAIEGREQLPRGKNGYSWEKIGKTTGRYEAYALKTIASVNAPKISTHK